MGPIMPMPRPTICRGNIVRPVVGWDLGHLVRVDGDGLMLRLPETARE